MNQPVKICTIDGRQRSKKSVLARMATQLEFPKHFGHNLDALYDCLTTDLVGPAQIFWSPTAAAKSAIGRHYSAIVDCLRDSAKTRDDLHFELRERT